MKTIDLTSFKKEDNFSKDLSLLLTVKSFDLRAIRKRYIASRKNKSGKAGSVKRREVSTGGLVSFDIPKGGLTQSEVLLRTKEPRGIDVLGEKLAFATEDVVHVHTSNGNYVLKHPWFSYIHTVKFSPHHENRILVVSSGLDILLEIDYTSNEVAYEWLAWENGWHEAHDPETNKPVFLTRTANKAKEWTEKGIRHKLIKDPQGQVLPTAMRAAFMNSVAYDLHDPNLLYATFFHEGAVFQIDRNTGKTSKVLGGLKNPHGGVPLNDSFFATSTSSGEVVIKKEGEQVLRIDFSNLEGKPEGLEDLEWLQNSISINDHSFLTIDSNRNQFVIFDLEQRTYVTVPYDDNWAVQDVIIHNLNTDERAWLKGVEETIG